MSLMPPCLKRIRGSVALSLGLSFAVLVLEPEYACHGRSADRMVNAQTRLRRGLPLLSVSGMWMRRRSDLFAGRIGNMLLG
jgi:hypothetical protein